MKIYIVHGETGEYSDRSDWNVCAYKNEEDAKIHVVKASEVARELYAKYQNDFMNWYDDDGVIKTNPYDKRFSMDYTGTNYGYSEVELHDKFTEEK